jgi:hypothetical protein
MLALALADTLTEHERYFIGGLIVGVLVTSFLWYIAMLFVLAPRRR